MGSAICLNQLRNARLAHGADDNSLYYVYANIYECIEYRFICRICIYHGYEYPRCSLCFFDCSIYGCIVGFIAIYKRGNLIICSEYIQSLKTLQPFLAMMKVNVDLMFRTVCLLTINNLFAIAGASMGTVTLASNAIILEIIFIVIYFIDGMANGVSVFSGKAKGYKDINLLNSVLKISLRCLAVFIIFISVIMYITKSYFINMMTDLAVVANYANDYSIYLILHPLCAVWDYFYMVCIQVLAIQLLSEI